MTRQRVGSPTLHLTILFTIAVFAALLAMAFFFRVEVVAQGQGRIVPLTRVQSIQPEFSGRITAISVTTGQQVAAGDILLALDDTDATAAQIALQAEVSLLQQEQARLQSFAAAFDTHSPDDPTFAEAARAQLGQTLQADDNRATQTDLLATQIEKLQAELGRIAAERDDNTASLAVSQANIARVDASLAIQKERLDTANALVESGTTSRAAMLDTLQAYTDLEKSREVYERELTQKRVSAEALDAGRRSLIATTRAQLADRLAEIAARLETLTEDLRTADRRVAATVITAPVAGTIDQLKVFTIGGIVEAGAELMRVVPSGTTYEVEAVFANQDVGFIRQGQPVNIRLDAFPSERFGFLRGTVADVAADSTQSDDGSFGYVVRITPKTKQLVVGAQSYPLRPGMTGRADVTTDERRIISYFFAPIVQVVQAALGER